MAEDSLTFNQFDQQSVYDLIKDICSREDSHRKFYTLYTGIQGTKEFHVSIKNLSTATPCCKSRYEVTKGVHGYRERCCKCKKFVK